MTGTSLNGASVLLLGATGGLGQALGEELAARGAAVLDMLPPDAPVAAAAAPAPEATK